MLIALGWWFAWLSVIYGVTEIGFALYISAGAVGVPENTRTDVIAYFTNEAKSGLQNILVGLVLGTLVSISTSASLILELLELRQGEGK